MTGGFTCILYAQHIFMAMAYSENVLQCHGLEERNKGKHDIFTGHWLEDGRRHNRLFICAWHIIVF